MSLRPAWVPVLMGEQPDRVRRGTASPALASPGIGSGGVGHLMTPAWKYRHERTRRHVGLTAPQSKSSQGTKKLDATRSARAPSLRSSRTVRAWPGASRGSAPG